jgi:hypothetical protein
MLRDPERQFGVAEPGADPAEKTTAPDESGAVSSWIEPSKGFRDGLAELALPL